MDDGNGDGADRTPTTSGGSLIPNNKHNHRQQKEREQRSQLLHSAKAQKNATPMTIILRASDMRIVYKEVGYSSGTVDLMIRSALF